MRNHSSILREKIVLQRRVLGEEGDFGDPHYEWEEITTLCGKFTPLKGRDFFNSQALPERVGVAEGKIVIRARKGMNKDEYRFVYGGIPYTIVGPPIYDRDNGESQFMVRAVSSTQKDGRTINA